MKVIKVVNIGLPQYKPCFIHKNKIIRDFVWVTSVYDPSVLPDLRADPQDLRWIRSDACSVGMMRTEMGIR
ncbi:hypothetical protein AT746_19055 [Lacimicrobium alkaliphilum]|uniref:Uncharacterized protein n=1 Tax=Lacimicrobium alkaliphilum TaxID=1526571 RepID=A0A0U2QQR8_9ALTE|nr:hypothetical protein AT746_19055 [Lacimicrobium alkaliphilum]